LRGRLLNRPPSRLGPRVTRRRRKQHCARNHQTAQNFSRIAHLFFQSNFNRSMQHRSLLQVNRSPFLPKAANRRACSKYVIRHQRARCLASTDCGRVSLCTGWFRVGI
jgi:hypothetical protein